MSNLNRDDLAKQRDVRAAIPRSSSAGVQRLTCVLGLLSSLLLEVAASEHLPNIPAIAGRMAVQTVLVVIGFVLFRRRADRGLPAPQSLVLILAAISAVPAIVEVVGREFFNRGWTVELTLLAFLRNLVLGLCAASTWPRYQRLGAALSVLLAIFAGSFGDDRSLVVLLSLYAVAGIWWLMGSYWDGLRDHITVESKQTLPGYWLIVLPVPVMAIVLLLAVDQGTATTALQGFMPSSGGTGRYDEFASGGVNDGDALVSAQDNASSFGPVETDLFLDSEDSSLYDAFDDQYNEPFKKSKTQKAISLPPGLLKESEFQIAEAKKANREFSTVRQPITDRSEHKDVDSEALLYVTGRTPLHLRLQEFDLFDGQNWYPSPAPENPLGVEVETIDGKPWVLVNSATPLRDIYGGYQSNVIKTVSIKGNRLPLPLHTVRLHIDRVDRPDLFAWAQQSILRLQRKSVPSLMVMHTRSRLIAHETLDQMKSDDFVRHAATDAAVTVPTDFFSKQMAKLAITWTKGVPRGWPQVNRILQKLRSEYVHDRSHVIDPEFVNPTAAFVLSERRGPDYLFASAAAVMLRSLEYPTRLVGGFYASPERFDPESGQTAVLKEDVHFWCEVYIGGRSWLPLEPTPGYELLKHQPGLIATVLESLRDIVRWTAHHWLSLSSVVVLIVLAQLTGTIQRVHRILADLFFTSAWKLSSRSDRARILASSQLINRRCRLVGLNPSTGETEREFLTRSLSRATADVNLSQATLDRWLRLVEWARFAPSSVSLPLADLPVGFSDDQLIQEICNAVSSKITARQLAVMHAEPRTRLSWSISGWLSPNHSRSSLENVSK